MGKKAKRTFQFLCVENEKLINWIPFHSKSFLSNRIPLLITISLKNSFLISCIRLHLKNRKNQYKYEKITETGYLLRGINNGAKEYLGSLSSPGASNSGNQPILNYVLLSV